MKIKPKYLAMAFAITAALLWSFYSFGVLLLTVLAIFFVEGANYTNLSGFNWVDHLNKYLFELCAVVLSTSAIGWFVAEIYNELEEFFNIKLK